MPARVHVTIAATFVLLASGAIAWLVDRAPASATAQEATPSVQLVGMTAQEAILAHESASRGPAQPIPFNHRFHVRELRMDCLYCHAGSDRSQVAIVPPLDLCMGCHRVIGNELEPIQQLRGYWSRRQPVPWERVYKLPEFVQFSHQPHLRNGIDCQQCHGPVDEMDRVYRVTSLRMGWCLECHFGEPRESDVATDYVLWREFPPPDIPAGRQSAGLYPIRIDEQYASNRAPIDCFACHY
ncbi:MAG: cytochrome c3 family protein [Gemmatimonadota bacterium]